MVSSGRKRDKIIYLFLGKCSHPTILNMAHTVIKSIHGDTMGRIILEAVWLYLKAIHSNSVGRVQSISVNFHRIQLGSVS